VELFNATAMTVWPFVFISPKVGDGPMLRMALVHEDVHYHQQGQWLVYGLGVGLLVWFFLYLFCLPMYWNYWRRKWETEAMEAQGLSAREIAWKLTQPPYYLTWENWRE
jgi:hypothetical protein